MYERQIKEFETSNKNEIIRRWNNFIIRGENVSYFTISTGQVQNFLVAFQRGKLFVPTAEILLGR
jgi:hypothetical protein